MPRKPSKNFLVNSIDEFEICIFYYELSALISREDKPQTAVVIIAFHGQQNFFHRQQLVFLAIGH